MNTSALSIFLILSFSLWSEAKVFEADAKFRPEVRVPVFTRNHPLILFDQGHRNLAANDGRYAPVLHLLETDGFKFRAFNEKISVSLLREAKILYISGAQGVKIEQIDSSVSPAFSEEECDLIQNWVKDGGSLLLMSDHSPIGDSIHPLAARFGIQISGGETNDPNNSLAALGDTSHLLFTIENGLLSAHPIIQGRSQEEQVLRIAVFSGQSVRGPPGSETILKHSSTAVIHYRNRTREPVAPTFAEAISMKYGRGRVVVYGDATVFTSKIHIKKQENEGMNRPEFDNVKLATNTFRWLAGALGDYKAVSHHLHGENRNLEVYCAVCQIRMDREVPLH